MQLLIEYLIRTGRLTGSAERPFMNVDFSPDGAIVRWDFPEQQLTPDEVTAITNSPEFISFSNDINKIKGREAARHVFDTTLKRYALVSLDEINALRKWVTDFKAATAAATSLADLKTRVAALSSLPQRTEEQLKNAMDNKD